MPETETRGGGSNRLVVGRMNKDAPYSIEPQFK